ncbi:UNVERIFIED_CONTAM: hypothetical protein Sradi_4380000 [Sesamum radiatum]|uniref:Uncharacterized protein n=1 Tax=Sesamum radiatum TaxID=300843 RepID=A0AAW2NPV4_SESRA
MLRMKKLLPKHANSMAFNTQQLGSRNDNPPRRVNEVNTSIDERLDELTSLVKRLIVGNTQQVKTCSIYTSSGHSTDACPTLHEEPTMYVNTVGGFSGPSQKGYDPLSNTNNPGWRDHPNLRYDYQIQNFQKSPPLPQSNSNSGKLPSQTIINPKQNVSAITLCSEKELQFENSTRRGQARQNRTKNSVVHGHAEQGKTGEEFENSPKQAEKSNQVGEEHPKVFMPKPPFPERFAKSKKEEGEKDILEILHKVEIYIFLLDVIKRVPSYAKFLKEMCTNKSKLRARSINPPPQPPCTPPPHSVVTPAAPTTIVPTTAVVAPLQHPSLSPAPSLAIAALFQTTAVAVSTTPIALAPPLSFHPGTFSSFLFYFILLKLHVYGIGDNVDLSGGGCRDSLDY